MMINKAHSSEEKTPSIVHSIPWLIGWASLAVMGPMVLMKLIYRTIQVFCYHLLDKEKQLHGKVVLLTGASSGLGKSLSHALYRRGCRLILASRNVKALEELKQSLIQQYNPPEMHIPVIVKLDLEDLNSIPDVIDEILKTHEHIDVLINNAGMSSRGEVLSTDISVHVKLMVVNYFGQIAITKAVLKTMVTAKSGHIIGVSSLQGKMALPFRSSYSASKHAFQAFLDSLRAEVACHDIDVTVISPGYIKTNLSYNAVTDKGDVHGVMDDTIASGYEPNFVAEKIVRCLITKEKEMFISPFIHRLVVYIRVLVPSLYFYIMKLRSWSTRKNMLKEKQS